MVVFSSLVASLPAVGSTRMTEPHDCEAKFEIVGSYHMLVVAPPHVTDDLAPDGIDCRDTSIVSGAVDALPAPDAVGGPGDITIVLGEISSSPRNVMSPVPVLSLDLHECLASMKKCRRLLLSRIAALRCGGVYECSALFRSS